MADENLINKSTEFGVRTNKTCKDCGDTYPLLRFYRAARMKDGHRNSCKYCDGERAAAKWQRYMAADPEKWRERARLYKRIYRSREKGVIT